MRTPNWVQVRSIVSNNRTVRPTFRIFGNLELTRNTAATMGLMRNPWRHWRQDYECKGTDDCIVFQMGDWISTPGSRSASIRQYSSTTCQPKSLQSQRLQMATWALPVGFLGNILFKLRPQLTTEECRYRGSSLLMSTKTYTERWQWNVSYVRL